MKNLGKTIQPTQMLEQWSALPNRFDVQLLSAKQRIGEISVDFFKRSFEAGGFYQSGEKWAERKHVYKHAILNKTGVLKDSIVYRLEDGSGLTVGTEESRFPTQRGRRESNAYAVFHNDPTGTWNVNQYSSEKIVQRQFIGRSDVLEKKILTELENIFKNLLSC